MKRTASHRRVIRMIRATTAGVAALIVLLAPVATSPLPAQAVGDTYYPISGVGSSWSANAMDQWIRNVFNNYHWKVTYDASGSSAGRQQFALGTANFAVSEIPYALAGSDSPDPRPKRQLSYVPIVAGGTSFMYNLVIGGKRVTNLRLSGENVAKIFTGVLTKWNDPAIAADNPKLALPALPIVPVVRSDGSGTSAQFTAWMRDQYPAVWNAYCAKAGRSNCGITSNYPLVSGSAFLAKGSSSDVATAVSGINGIGAITYVEYSYALNAHFPVAKVLNTAGYYTEPTASNVAVALLAAGINKDPSSPDYLTQQLKGVYSYVDPRTYPLSSYSYMIIPTALEGSLTENMGLTLADFASYFLCEGQQQAEVLGYSPLPINLAQAGLEQIQKIPGGNPKNKSITGCNNPTFSADGSNKLAATAPQPEVCDKRGADQCLTGTGGAKNQATAAAGGASVSKGSGGSGAPTANGGGGDAGSNAADGGGEAVGLSGAGNPVVAGEPVDLPQHPLALNTILAMVVATVLVLVCVLLPPVIARRRRAVAGAPRGPTVRRTALSFAKLKINLPAVFRSRGRADVSSTDS